MKSAAVQIGCSYEQILDAALHDAGYLNADRATAADSTPRAAGAAFIHNVIVAEGYSGRADNRVHEWARGPGIWTVAHRGYSGYRRLDLWAYPDEAAALKAAARLGIECGLDEDQAAVDAYARHDYRAVLDRHRETAPEWQILTVELTYFVGDSDELVATSSGVDPYTSLDCRIPDAADAASGEDPWGGTRAADDEELALMENDDEYSEYSEIVELVSSRQATLIANAADEIAAAIRSDADTLGSAPVTPVNRSQLDVLATLPSVTFGQSRLWRYQLAAAADRLAADTRLWGRPSPVYGRRDGSAPRPATGPGRRPPTPGATRIMGSVVRGPLSGPRRTDALRSAAGGHRVTGGRRQFEPFALVLRIHLAVPYA